MADTDALLTVGAYAQLIGRRPQTVYTSIEMGTVMHEVVRRDGLPLMIRVPLEFLTRRQSSIDRRQEPRGGRRSTDVPKIECQRCGSWKSTVVTSEGTKRRRQCASCHFRYNTREILSDPTSKASKVDPSS